MITKGKVVREVQEDESYDDFKYCATCVWCGGTRDIEMWPHYDMKYSPPRMIGIVYLCLKCTKYADKITIEIHREISGQENKPGQEKRHACKDCIYVGNASIDPNATNITEHNAFCSYGAKTWYHWFTGEWRIEQKCDVLNAQGKCPYFVREKKGMPL